MPACRFIALIAIASINGHAADPEAGFVRDAAKVRLQSPFIAEASGVAASVSRKDMLWFINDSGGTAEIHAAGSDGTSRGKTLIQGARNLDWEDLASFKLGGKPYLLIADTGDNTNKRPDATLYVVPEPSPGALSVAPAWTLRFRYEDGPRDCESVAVDEKAAKVILISKRTRPPVLYELPLRPPSSDVQIARKIGTIARPLPKGRSLNPFGRQPTGFDISPDGSLAAVVTYCGAFLFPRKPGESWDTAFSRDPVLLPGHNLSQAEAIAFDRDATALHVVSEGARPPLVTYRKSP
ncbi:hypothetical protein [Luteolibacter marinus]|uniref:hypothetical protein n=1 Tax=Luteolibacter marinus TaxID=2776705 RepID=UPI001868EB95|nr:hypothetical protein [Luteolibacter marinus]